MGFLNNSGDIILDAVLTDSGRMRLAKGDGSFRIAKFALADDEIDYSLYNANTGSAYVDIQILQTPVLESFTNNASSLKSKLLSLNIRNILHLPTMLVNDKETRGFTNRFVLNGYTVAVDKATEDYILAASTTINGSRVQGVLRGFTTANSPIIRVDQGLNTTAVQGAISPELKETQYIIEIDNRLGVVTDKNNVAVSPSYVDDDDIASYSVALATDPELVEENRVDASSTAASQASQVIAGPRGTILNFGIESSLSLKTSQYLFNTIGTTYTATRVPAAGTLKIITSNVIVTGATTGYSLTIPIAYIKYIA